MNNEPITLQCIFCTKNKFLQIQFSRFELIIGFLLLFRYSALTIPIVQILFGNQKMNENEYRIPLFGPNYLNSLIVRIIYSNTAPQGSGSTQVSALMKGGAKTWGVSLRLNIPMRTLQTWRKASKESGNWNAPSGLARPAKFKTDPGSCTGGWKVNRRMTERM